MRLLALTSLILFTQAAFAQGDHPEFAVGHRDNLCRNSPIRLSNMDTDAESYYWNFCPEDFEESPVNASTNVNGSGQGYGYELVQNGDQWYGFLVSRSLDKLFRLDFGNDPLNPPSVTDLGNPGGFMDAPEGIAFFKDGLEWFAFIGKGENSTGQVVKFSFGSDLTSMPSATGYGTFGLGSIRIRDVSIVRQADDIIVVLPLYNLSALNRINFGNSLRNSPGPNDIISIQGASFPRALEIISDCNPLRAHVISDNGLIQQISFGNGVLGAITTEGSFTFNSVVQPWKIRTVFSGGNYYSIISNNSRKYSIINFGDLSLDAPPLEVPNNNDVRFIGMDVIKYKGKTLIQGAGQTSALLSVSYHRMCNLEQDFSYGKNPPSPRYSKEGQMKIDLTAFINQNESWSSSQELEIRALDAPSIDIIAEGMCQGEEVKFMHTNSLAISSWFWELGDGQTSLSPSPITSYSAPGSYSIFLNAEATNTCLTGDSIEITIYPPPVPEFIVPSGLLCTNNVFTFSSTTTDVYSGSLTYSWFIDQINVGVERDLEYTFANAGSKEIRFVTSIPGCANEITKVISDIQTGPLVDFVFSGTCESDSFVFQSQFSDAVESYSWEFGDGQISSDLAPEHQFDAAGDYPVTLSATNSIGCQTKKTKEISVHSIPVIDFEVVGPPNTCSGQATLFESKIYNPDDRQIFSLLWKFGDGNDSGLGSEPNITHIFSEPGTYNVSLVATTAGGCVGSFEKEVAIHPSPSHEFTHTPTCANLPVTFSTSPGQTIAHFYWEIGSSYYYDPSPTHTFKSPGDFPVYLEVIGTNGCIAETNTNIHVPVPLTPDFSVTKNCVDQQAIFTDITSGLDPVATRSWNFNPGGYFTGQEVGVTFQQEGEISATLRVTAESGCSYEITRPVVVRAAPHASFEATPTEGGYPLEVQFLNTSSDATHYLWSFQNETSSDVSPIHTFREAGDFDVTLTAYNEQECEHTFTSVITAVPPLPDADIDLITLSPNDDGTYRLIVTIHNKGNTFLRDVPVDIDFGGSLQLREVVQETIAPSSKYNLVLGTGILHPDILEYLCVSMEVSNDRNSSGNRKCLRLDNDLFVFNVFPNPASGQLTVEWISHASHTLRVSIVDALGREMLTSRTASAIGLNRQTLDVSAMESGIYYLLFEDGATRHRQRIVVSNNR